MPRISLGLGISSSSKLPSVPAPSGIITANAASLNITNTITNAGAGAADGLYIRRAGNTSTTLCAGGTDVHDNDFIASNYYYEGPTTSDEYSGCTRYFLMGPNTRGNTYGYAPSGPVTPQGVWKLYSAYQDNESPYTDWQQVASSVGSNVNVVPTASWSPSITIIVVPPSTPTPTPTVTPTPTPTQTTTPTPTRTITPTPTRTITPTPTRTQTLTLTQTPTQTMQPTLTVTPSITVTSTPTSTVTSVSVGVPIPERITTLSDTAGWGGSWGVLRIGQQYASWEPLAGSNLGTVFSTTTVGGTTNSSENFTSFLSPVVQTYNGNRDIQLIVVNPRHALNYGGVTKEPSWALFILDVGHDAENGDNYSANLQSTNPSTDPYNFPTSGWTNGFQPYVQLARDITVSITGFYDIYSPTTHPDPYGGYYSEATPRVKVLQKQNRTPIIRDQVNSWTNTMWNNFQPANIRGGARMPVFYALLGYMYAEDPHIPWGGTRQLIFGYTHEFFGYGWPLTKSIPWTSSIVSSDYNITTLKNVWVLTSSGTYSHGDGSGSGLDAGTYYNVLSNTNANVLPPALNPITSPTWRLVTNYNSGFERNQLSAYTPNYSPSPVADIITASGSIYSYLNREWVRLNVGDAVGESYSTVVFLKSGTAYQDLHSGYIMLAPNSVIAVTELNETTVFPLTGGAYDAFTCPADKWKIIYSYYESDYNSFTIYENWEATSSNANLVPQTFTGAGGNTNSISFVPTSFY